jgi:hypothetical protein
MTPSPSALAALDKLPAFRKGRAWIRMQEAERLKVNGEWTIAAAAQERIAAEIERGER